MNLVGCKIYDFLKVGALMPYISCLLPIDVLKRIIFFVLHLPVKKIFSRIGRVLSQPP
jgi:hypothetical protein